jgi:hypothetical protein
MACYQTTALPAGVAATGRTAYRTQAECLQACKEGACCEGTTCSVKPQCQCQGAGKTFKGVGTTCVDVSCGCCGGGEQLPSGAVQLRVKRTLDVIANSACACVAFQSPPTQDTRCRDQNVVFSSPASSGCSRSVQGNTPDLSTRFGSIFLVPSTCLLVASVAWPHNPCGGNSLSVYFAWPFVPGQTSYEATYYLFLLVDGMGNQTFLTNTTGVAPRVAPPYFAAGSKWTTTLELSFA